MLENLDACAKKLFDRTVDLLPAERAGVVEQECAGHPELRVRLLDLLRAADKDDAFLRELTSGSLTSDAEAVPEEMIGSAIGPYRLLERIGEGGFGTVFLAEQSAPVTRRVALKIIKFGMDSRSVVARFEQERQALALMDHPNIARVLEAGATAAGRPYFVMELVKGESIVEFCDTRNLSIAERIELFCQACRAVQHAHTRGIIHRDIKPTNILVEERDGRPLCKVIDFGIAKAMLRPLTDKTIFTEQRQLIGTPEYMSPEQAASSPDIDTRTDVYSLGVLLYELLAGLKPFDPKVLRSGAYEEVQRIIREVDPPVPSTRLSQSRTMLAVIAAKRKMEPRRLGAVLRGELDWIVMKALEKDRGRRYESPGNLAADVERYLNGMPVEAGPPGVAYRLRKFVRRRRVPVVAGLLVVGALLTGSIGTTVGFFRARQERGEAIAQAELAKRNATLAAAAAERADHQAEEARLSANVAHSVSSLMSTMLQAADRGRNEGRADITVREVMDTASRELLEQRATPEPHVQLQLAKTIGDTYKNLSLLESAEKMRRFAAGKARDIYGEHSIEYAGALGEIGEVVQSRGDFDGADALYQQALGILAGLGSKGEDAALTVRRGAASLASARGRLNVSEADFRALVADYVRAGRTSDPVYAAVMTDLASVVFQRGDLAEAESLYIKAIAVEPHDNTALSPQTLARLHNLGVIQYSKKDLPAALATMRKEVELARTLYGEDHRLVAEALQSLSVALFNSRDFEGTAKARAEALEIDRKILGPSHPDVGEAAANLGSVLLSMEKFDEAEALFRTASDILLKTPGPEYMNTIYARYQLSLILEKRGELVEAERILRDDLAAAGRSLTDGTRYEWVRHAVSSLLGAVVVEEAVNASPTDRLAKMREAGELVPGSAERLLALTGRMGKETRVRIIEAALRRVVRFYEVWNSFEPDPDRAAKLASWSSRLEAFLHGDAK